MSMDALIDNAENALSARRTQDQGGLEKELYEINERREALSEFRDIQKNIETQQAAIQDAQSKLHTVLAGIAIDDLRDSLSEARTVASVEVLRHRIVRDAIVLMHRTQEEPIHCPVCEAVYPRQHLKSVLCHTTAQPSGDTTTNLTELEAKLEQAEEREREIQRLRSVLDELESNADIWKIIHQDGAEALPGNVSTTQLNVTIEGYSKHATSVDAQIRDQKGLFDEMEASLTKLKEEERYHRLQKELIRLNRSMTEFERVNRVYQEFVLFGQSVRTIEQTVGICLTERLEGEIPSVSENLSEVFAALTRHPWYDLLIIDKSTLPRLELQVASGSDPSGRMYPTGVLNGQAESALALVPYFAFGQTDDTPTEVYLVLLDDPTRAFDDEHIEILVERLAELGSNVQLVVASQETARFRTLLPKKFDSGSYIVVEPTRWSYSGGPELNIES